MTTAVAASLSVAEGQGPVGERELAFMRRALAAAELASGRGEVPVGAVVVVGGEIVSVAHNERETGGDPTAHAEILALRRAAAALGRWRLLRSEEHTSELQSRPHLVCRLLLAKKTDTP